MERNSSEKPGCSTGAPHLYMLCGWRTLSEIPLTGISPLADSSGNLDVVIQVATERLPMTKSTGQFEFQHSPERSIIKIEDVADFEITGGRQIRVWPAAGASRKDIEIFLFGKAWATLCHQREMLPLHASAIVTKGGIAAFAGNSGVGKSTMAALLDSLGYELLADDILPVSFNQHSIPGAWPYLRRAKLLRDPIIQLGFTPAEMVSETLDKQRYFVLPKSAGHDMWRKLERIYLLEGAVTSSHAPIEQITGTDAVQALIDQTYHFDFVFNTRRLGEHLDFCARLAAKIPIYRLRRLRLRDAGKRLSALVCAHLEESAE